jgi:D-tyrosyl-tRNA(Tyr) deacylase
MRVLVQRVLHASVTIEGAKKAQIGRGVLVFVGVENADTHQDAEWLAAKVVNLRIFDDEQGVMNRSVLDVDGEMLIISQFTLHALTAKGNRPSYIRAAKPMFRCRFTNSFVLLLPKNWENPYKRACLVPI